MCVIPMIRDVHSDLIHRLIHRDPPHSRIDYLHHNNVNVGPSTGLSMHPIQYLLDFSGVLVHWVIPSHPIHALFHLQHAGITPAQGHAGFERVILKTASRSRRTTHSHFLHHKYFDVCNSRWSGVIG